MAISTGDTLPDVNLIRLGAEGPEAVSLSSLTKGRKVVIFAVPGAYTPTCSAKHLPGFVEKQGDMAVKGVDDIVCTSVNDVFVMGAWGKDNNVSDKVRMLADGNGAFAAALGLEMDGSGFGMGQRSQRYSMLVRDGVVAELNVEQGGAFEVSSADYLLGQL